MNEVKSGIRFADGPIPAQLRSRGRSPDERSEIRERTAGLNACPGFRCAHPGYLLRQGGGGDAPGAAEGARRAEDARRLHQAGSRWVRHTELTGGGEGAAAPAPRVECFHVFQTKTKQLLIAFSASFFKLCSIGAHGRLRHRRRAHFKLGAQKQDIGATQQVQRLNVPI
jgi:hypothetical protein